jgi:hypothetical protein
LVTTELTVGFQFHLPYLTREGDTTSILIATGPHVKVNMILGLPFIQATRAVIDLADNVAELCALNAPPFPLKYRRTTVHVPIVDEGNEHPVHMANAYSDLIAEINSLERHFTSADLMLVKSAGVDGARSVRFGAHPVGVTHISQTTLQLTLTYSTRLVRAGLLEIPRTITMSLTWGSGLTISELDWQLPPSIHCIQMRAMYRSRMRTGQFIFCHHCFISMWLRNCIA